MSITLSLIFLGATYYDKLASAIKNKANFYGLLLVLHLSLSILISLAFNMRALDLNVFGIGVTSLLQVISYVLFVGLLNFINREFFLTCWVYFTFCVLCFLLFLIHFEFNGVFENGYLIRNFLNDNVPQGLNRFLNGLSVLLILPLAIVMKVVRRSRVEFYLSMAILFMAVVIIMVSGARQFLLALILSFFFLVFINSNNYKDLVKKSLYIFMAALFLSFLVYHLVPSVALEFFISRSIETTNEQLIQGSDRIERYKLVYFISSQYPLFGIGAGGFYKEFGFYVDSGILQILVEQGLLHLAIHLMIFCMLIRYFFCVRSTLSTVSKMFISVFVVTFLVLNLFNELQLSYFMWLLIPLSISFRNYHGKYR
jgi:hypothetical protein